MKATAFFVALAAAVLFSMCAALPPSAPSWAEQSIVLITAEVEVEAVTLPFPFNLLPGSTSLGAQRSARPTLRAADGKGLPSLPKITEIHGGTGFAMNGRIYTCEHVIHGAKRIYVTLRDGRYQWARLLRSDKGSDLAELQVGDMPPSLTLRSYAPRFPERVWEIGNPADLRWVTTTGYMLTFDGFENRFLIDTWFGNSGSPIMDAHGYVVGMAHNIISGTRYTGGGTMQDLRNFIYPETPR